MDLNTLITQAPNFVGFIVCAAVQWKIIMRQMDQISALTSSIIKRENCADEAADAAAASAT